MAPVFPDFAAAEQYIRAVSATFGAHSDAEWRLLTEHVVRRQPDGSYRMHYDPAIAVPFARRPPTRTSNCGTTTTRSSARRW